MDVSTSSEIDVIREENPASGKNGSGTQKKGRKSTSNSQASAKESQKSSSSSGTKKGKGKKSNPGSSPSSGTLAEEKEVKANKNGKMEEEERSSPDSSPTLKEKKGSEDEETSGRVTDDKSSFPADLFEDTNAAERVKSASYRRQRKQVDRFAPSFLVRTNMMEEIGIPEGKGAKLQDISNISKKINDLHVADLLKLHRFIFGRTGTHSVVKSHLLKFFGFDFDKESEEYEKKRRSLTKMDKTAREYFCDCLCLSKEGTQEEIIERILNFLLVPSADAITMDNTTDNKTEPNGRAKGQASPTKNPLLKIYKKNEKVSTEKVKKGTDSEPKTVIPLPQDIIERAKLEMGVATTDGSKKQTKTTSKKKSKAAHEDDDTDGSTSDTPSPPPKKKAPAKRKPKKDDQSALSTSNESKEQGQTSKKKKPAAKRKADKETDAEEGLTVSSPKKKRWNSPV